MYRSMEINNDLPPDGATSAAIKQPADAAPLPDQSPSQQPLSRYAEGSLRELLAIALPLMISTGSHSIMIFCDRLFLTAVGTAELGAAFSAGMVSWSAIAIPLGTLGYASTFVSQNIGAGDDLAARRSIWQSFYLGIAAGLLLLLTIPAAKPIFALFGHAPDLQLKEVLYFQIIMLAVLPRLVIGAFFCNFSGRGETHIPMIAAVIGNTANIVISYALIYGHYGLPALGLAGAAWGTVIATLLELVFYGGFIITRRPETLPIWWQARGFDRDLSGRLIRYGLPAGIQMFSDATVFTLSLQMVGTLGEAELAATTIAFSTNAIVFVPLIGLGMALGTIVGHRVGAERPSSAEQTVTLAIRIGGLMMGAFAIACVFFPGFVIAPYDLYNKSAETSAQAVAEFEAARPLLVMLLRFLAAFALFDTMAVLYSSAIRGAGDTRFSLIVLAITGWGLLVLPIFVMKATDTLTLSSTWAVLTFTIFVQGLIFAARYFGGKWKSMSVMS